MPDNHADRVPCPDCGRAFRFKPELSGKKVKCACGLVIRMPLSPELDPEIVRRDPPPTAATAAPMLAAAPDAADDLMPASFTPVPSGPDSPAAAPTSKPRCPSCGGPLKPTAVICINCGFNLQTGAKLNTAAAVEPVAVNTAPLGGSLAAISARSGLNADALADEQRQKQFRNEVLIPLICLIAGALLALLHAFVLRPMAIEAGELPFGGGHPTATMQDSVIALIVTGLRLVVQIPLLLISIVLVARLFGSSFGPILTAMLKLAALALLVGAVDDNVSALLDYITGGFGGIGWMISSTIVFGVFWGLCMMLFEMEALEILVLYGLIIFLPIFVMMFAAGIILSMFA